MATALWTGMLLAFVVAFAWESTASWRAERRWVKKIRARGLRDVTPYRGRQ